jgi:membrane protease YdiL (CAAX protease family)
VLAAAVVAGLLDRLLFGQAGAGDEDIAVATAIALLLVNGLIVPAAEEVAWRGVLQPAFVRRFGAVAGICVTAALFSLKHVVVDASLGRILTLFAFGVAVGVIRHRLGLSAAIGAHMGANLLATTGALLAGP